MASKGQKRKLCPGCSLVCENDPGGLWVCCDNRACDTWYCFNCSGIADKEDIPEYYSVPHVSEFSTVANFYCIS